MARATTCSVTLGSSTGANTVYAYDLLPANMCRKEAKIGMSRDKRRPMPWLSTTVALVMPASSKAASRSFR